MLTSLLRFFLARKIRPYEFIKTHEIEYRPRLKELGLYIHIPFCKQICNFCPYNKILYDKQLANEYTIGLINELRFLKDKFQDKKITSVYVGGGTPSLLKEGLEKVFAYINENFNFHGEIAVELHPSDSDIQTLKFLNNIGVNLISLGLQSSPLIKIS